MYRVWTVPRLLRVVVFLAATVAGQRFCAFVSRRLVGQARGRERARVGVLAAVAAVH